jgi:GGDEF domain-containing protein
VLKEFARIGRETLRETDVLGRIGCRTARELERGARFGTRGRRELSSHHRHTARDPPVIRCSIQAVLVPRSGPKNWAVFLMKTGFLQKLTRFLIAAPLVAATLCGK